MTKLSNIDIAYEYLKKKKGCASFLELWSIVEKETIQKDADKKMLMASLYTSLVCDSRFSLTAENEWGLSDQLKDNDLKKKLGNTIVIDERDELNDSVDLTEDSSLSDTIDNTQDNVSFYSPTENESFDTYIREDDTFEKDQSF